MKELWSEIDFNPQPFEITEVEHDDSESLENLEGERKVPYGNGTFTKCT